MRNIRGLLLLLTLAGLALGAGTRGEKKGWIEIHLKGTPREIGLQHGRLLAPEIADALKAIQVVVVHDTHKDWEFFRRAGKEILWPKVETEYREEMEGIAAGLKERGSKLDIWDVVAMNGFMEIASYYVPEYDKKHGITTPSSVNAPEHCSAFIAVGSFTKDGKIVAAHNAWVDFVIGERWNIIFDIAPAKGQRMIMDGFPGLIHSADDFGINAAGIVLTETTISNFHGFDENGIPEFVRGRKALQYGTSIDEVVAIFKEGNNGGYANAWLIGDRKTNEIARLELGLKNVTLERKKDGYFVGSNFPIAPKLIAEETHDFDPKDLSTSPTARRIRWEQLMKENKGKIDVKMAQTFLGDDWDSFENKKQPNERTLCGRIDLSPRGSSPWQPAYGPCGAVQNKAADDAMIRSMSMTAAYGPICGPTFRADAFLAAHPEYNYQKGVLRDMVSQGWTEFKIRK